MTGLFSSEKVFSSKNVFSPKKGFSPKKLFLGKRILKSTIHSDFDIVNVLGH